MGVRTWEFTILLSMHFYMSETFHTVKNFAHFNSVPGNWNTMYYPLMIEM